ncbi:MAG TPA: hypothetical protein VLG47_01130 [Candidatus Saccharimonadales bacterium]|nr:hypothetical protein [Candidatus Saccharimonadales bacterium]
MHPKEKNFNPDQALAHSLSLVDRNEKVANRLPDLKKSAYILLGLTLFSAAQMFVFKEVIVSMLGSTSAKGFITWVSVATWIVSAIACLVVLNTKSTKLVKIILIIFACELVYDTITGLFHFDIIGTAINLFIAYWTYHLYDSVDGLGYHIH